MFFVSLVSNVKSSVLLCRLRTVGFLHLRGQLYLQGVGGLAGGGRGRANQMFIQIDDPGKALARLPCTLTINWPKLQLQLSYRERRVKCENHFPKPFSSKWHIF